MAEVKVPFSRVVQKHAGRARERLLQNLGKVDKTTDEHFDEYVVNFSKQHQAAQKLYKEMKNYHQCLRAMQTSHKALMETICEIYEPHWVEYDQVLIKAEMLEKKWEDFYNKINEQVIKPLSSYCDQFPDMSNKISKRGRKLLDYDSCRRHTQHLEQAKKKEESKLLKAKEQLVEARTLYDVINTELHEELPALYDSRISFLVSNLQCLFLAETTFHNESAVVFSDLNDAIEALASESQKGTYSTRKQLFSGGAHEVSSQESFKSLSPIQLKSNGETGEKSSSGKSNDYFSCETTSKKSSNENLSSNLSSAGSSSEKKDSEKSYSENTSTENLQQQLPVECEANDLKSSPELKNTVNDVENAGTAINLPPGVLFKVKATYKYAAEDADELSFDDGDIINVIDFDDPEQQEEGWLMGYKEGDGQKGLFPANFTRPL